MAEKLFLTRTKKIKEEIFSRFGLLKVIEVDSKTALLLKKSQGIGKTEKNYIVHTDPRVQDR